MNFIKETFTPPQLVDNKRVVWMDLAKGICIFLVMFGHVYGAKSQGVFFQQLRMPLYFVLSGLFFKDYGSFVNFLIKKTNKLLIPFIFFYVLSISFQWILHLVATCDLASNPFPNFKAIFESRQFYNNAIWFLLCLFEINILYFVVQRVFKSKYAVMICSVLIGIFGAGLAKLNIRFPLFIDSAFTALPLFYFGTILRRSIVIQDSKHIRSHALMACLIIFALIVIPIYINPSIISFVDNEINGSYLVALICSALGVISMLLLCKFINWLPLFSYMGRYSIVVLCVHMLYLYIFRHFFSDIQNVKIFELIVDVLLSWCTIPLAIKYIPWFTAQKDLIHTC